MPLVRCPLYFAVSLRMLLLPAPRVLQFDGFSACIRVQVGQIRPFPAPFAWRNEHLSAGGKSFRTGVLRWGCVRFTWNGVGVRWSSWRSQAFLAWLLNRPRWLRWGG